MDELNDSNSPTPPDSLQTSGESPIFGLVAVLIMILVLIGGGYYFLHKSGAAKGINNAINATNSTR